MRKVLFSATLVRGHIAKFHIPYLEWFKEQGWETWVTAHNDYEDGNCSIPFCDHFVDVPFARSPFSPTNVHAYRMLREVIDREHFDIIHAHTPVGGVLTRLAARKARQRGTKVVYTAHGFHFYDGAPVINWLLWYPVERFMSRFADVLITINQEDYERAKRFAHCRVEYVPGVGVDLPKFFVAECREKKREELGFLSDDYILLSVGDLIPRKNQGVIIDALSRLHPKIKLIICGEGPEYIQLESLAGILGVSDRVHLLGFRNDIAEIMAASDVFVFPSIHEGLPVSVMEAMASKLAVVASKIRGVHPDLIVGGVSGVLLCEKTAEEIVAAVTCLVNDPGLRDSLVVKALAAVQRFDLMDVLGATCVLYQDLEDGDTIGGMS